MEKYRLNELTPASMRCGFGSCPSVYEVVEDITPKEMSCGLGACPQIHQHQDSYLIIGKKVDPQEAGLAEKVGDDEVLISVPKALIDKRGQ